jgi:hypothetical protein
MDKKEKPLEKMTAKERKEQGYVAKPEKPTFRQFILRKITQE